MKQPVPSYYELTFNQEEEKVKPTKPTTTTTQTYRENFVH